MSKQVAAEHKDKGNKAFAGGKFSEAVSWYSKAIQADPADHVLYSNRSAAYAGGKDYAKALADADECIRIKSDWAKGYFRKAVAQVNMDRAVDAIDTLNKGLAQEPGNVDLIKKLEEIKAKMPKGKAQGLDAKAEGNEHFKLSRYDQAITSYKIALLTIQDPNERATIFSNKAACYHQLRSYDEVVTYASESLTLVPTHTKSLLRRGLAYESLEKFKLAIIDLQKVTELEGYGTALSSTAGAALHRIKAAQARFDQRAGK